MKVFISWSGSRGLRIARALNDYLTQLEIDTFFSDEIAKGRNWPKTLEDNLQLCSFAFVVVTPDSLNSSWLAYEAGALDHGMEQSRVCPILFDLHPNEIHGPLSHFQATVSHFNSHDEEHLQERRTEFCKLFASLNAVQENPMAQVVFDTVFEKWWPTLEETLEKACLLSVEPYVDDSQVGQPPETNSAGIAVLQRRVAAVNESLNYLAIATQTPTYFLDAEYNITYANSSAQLVFGLRVRVGRQQPLRQLLHDVRDAIENYDEVMDHYEEHFVPPDTAPDMDFEVLKYEHPKYGKILLRKTAVALLDVNHVKRGWVVAFNIARMEGVEKFYTDLELRTQAAVDVLRDRVRHTIDENGIAAT